MPQLLDSRTRTWIGRTLIDRAGQRIGRIDDIYTDDVGGQPAWLAVATGRFGLNIIFLPFAGATPAGGDELRVQFPKSLIKDAPVAGRGGRLTRDEVVRLYDHYGFDLEAEEVRERSGGQTGRPRGGYRPAHTHGPPTPAPKPAPPVEQPAPRAREEAASDGPPRSPTSRFRSLADLPPPRPDSPLLWNHDERIDSIRPPLETARPGRR